MLRAKLRSPNRLSRVLTGTSPGLSYRQRLETRSIARLCSPQITRSLASSVSPHFSLVHHLLHQRYFLALHLSVSKVNGLRAWLATTSQALIILYELREVAGIDTGAPQLLPNSADFDRCDCHWLLQVGHTQRHRPYTDIYRPRICVVDNGAYESHI